MNRILLRTELAPPPGRSHAGGRFCTDLRRAVPSGLPVRGPGESARVSVRQSWAGGAAGGAGSQPAATRLVAPVGRTRPKRMMLRLQPTAASRSTSWTGTCSSTSLSRSISGSSMALGPWWPMSLSSLRLAVSRFARLHRVRSLPHPRQVGGGSRARCRTPPPSRASCASAPRAQGAPRLPARGWGTSLSGRP